MFPYARFLAAGEEGEARCCSFCTALAGAHLHGGQVLDGKRGKPMQLIRGNPVQHEAFVRPATSFVKTNRMPRTTANVDMEGVYMYIYLYGSIHD